MILSINFYFTILYQYYLLIKIKHILNIVWEFSINKNIYICNIHCTIYL